MKTKTIATSIAALAVISSALALHAKPGGGEKGEERAKGGPDAAEVFRAIDSDDDKKITPEELAASKRFKDATPEEVAKAFAAKDGDGDGSIRPKEFARSFGGPEGHGPRAGGAGKGEKGRKRGKGGKGKAAAPTAG